MYREARHWTYELFAAGEGGDLGKGIDWFIMTLIAVNVAAVMLGTVDWISTAYGEFLRLFEVFSVVVFTLEYVGRIWSAVEHEEYEGIITGRIRFASRFLLVIDLLAILPFYLMFFGIGADLRFLRAVRLIRFIRLFKLARYSKSMQVFSNVLKRKKPDIVLVLFVNLILLVLAASILYSIEHPHQPEVFTSIPETLYWAIITLSTVGYGDVVPVTTLGRFFAGIVGILGVALFAAPASILAAGLIEEETGKRTPEYHHCPNCGEELN